MGKLQSPCQLDVSNSRFRMYASSCSASACHLALKGADYSAIAKIIKRPLDNFLKADFTRASGPR